MTHITEIIPDLDKLPDWARKAFEDGQFFNVVAKKIEEIEAAEAKLAKVNEAVLPGDMATSILKTILKDK